MIGETILHYRIVEKLGEGGMGEVWKAQDTRLDRFVALKFLPEKTGENPATVERFLREARAASALNHSGICTIHDIGEWEGRRYIVMEFMEGVTLGQKASDGSLDIETIVETGIQLADALDAAHGKNIIHRDIKSTNIILSPRGQAKILDFGLAKIALPEGRSEQEAKETDRTIQGDKDLTDAGQAVGTVSYMSPEQALGKDVDGRTDIFSLGVVLYEMATGRQAFPGSTTAAIFDAILNKSPTSPISLNAELPVELERIINKALEKDRDLRYQSAADLMTDLKRMRRDSSSQTVSTAAATQPRGRGRWIGLVVGTVAVAALAFAAYMGLVDRSLGPVGPVVSKPLTSLVGVEESGTWSPDGSFFAFGHSASGPADIYVMSVSGGDPIHLVASEADDNEPRWSPDNRWIAFSSNRGGPHGIYLIPPLGGSTQKLVDLGIHGLNASAEVGAMPWSPDGRFYLYAKRDTSGARGIWKIEVDSRRETKLTTPPAGSSDFAASWSFDAKQIAFSRISDQGRSIMVMSPDGEDVREAVSRNADWLPEGHFGVEYPAWSPDSKNLVLGSAWGSSGIWMTRQGSGKASLIVSGARYTGGVSVSRSGRFLYNTSDHQTDLYVRDLESGDERRLTAHTQDNGGGRFSPDGTRVAYSSSRTGDFEIWILDVGSGTETRLTNNTESDDYPEWSPDGHEIVFTSGRAVGGGKAGESHLWITSVDGGGPRLLSEQQGDGPVRWSPGGKLIGFVVWEDEGPALWVVGRAGGSARKILDDVGDFGWYRDDGHVIVTTHSRLGLGEMRGVDLDSGEHVTLLTDPQVELAVSPDGSAVSYCSATSHFNMNLHILPLGLSEFGLPRAVGAPKQITHGGGEWHVHNGGWSRDGGQVVYTRDTDSGDIFLLEGVFGEEN